MTTRKEILWLVLGSLPTITFGQSAPKIAPVPHDPLEVVTGQVEVAETPAARNAAIRLLSVARSSYQLKNAEQPWDLKVSFTVDSQGQTNYDGAWTMEDLFSPGQGVHWTATTEGYSITGIFAGKANYAEATSNAVPLRLQEARAMLFNPIPSTAYARNESIRTASASLNGSALTCVLLSRSRNISNPGRSWDESEDCIDQKSGLLALHSEAPSRYAVYDYTGASRLGTHLLPKTVTVTEAGRVVSTISVESLEGTAAVDPNLFVPTDAMKAADATAMTSATKVTRVQGQRPFTAAMTVRPVCVFGIVTSAGQLVEAHSLQPSDPNSAAAVADARAFDFSPSIPAGGPPRQHFVFVIEKFVN